MTTTPGSEHHVSHHRPAGAGILHTRQPVPPYAKDTEPAPPEVFTAEGLERLYEALQAIARAAENRANAVDEYNSAAISGAGSSAVVNVVPIYEYAPEKIESVLITGPPGNIVVQLGDRTWALTVPATGFIVLAPVALLLSRTDQRILTPSTPGTYTLELMGIADRRFKI